MHQYIQVLLQQGLTDMGLNQPWWGIPPWSSKFEIRPLILLPIQYTLLSPNCLAKSPIMPKFSNILLKLHMTSIDRKDIIASGFQPLLLYR
jgi:hypothetical protein